jgi:soluble lytic murein transglycosylase-like protein
VSSIAQAIFAEAQRQGVDPALALEVANAESGLNQSAVGAAGEIGVFQLMPATAAQLGVNPYDLAQNIQGGITYLRQLLAQFGDPAKAVAAYNCGPGCVSAALAYGADWFSHIPSSTQSYVTKILGNVQTSYTAQFNPAPAFVASGATMNIPPASSAAAPSSGIWFTLAIAAAVFFGLGFVLDES